MKAQGMNRQTVLISGMGIAGPTLAYWLKAAGFHNIRHLRLPGPASLMVAAKLKADS